VKRFQKRKVPDAGDPKTERASRERLARLGYERHCRRFIDGDVRGRDALDDL
jgi:hypothetical protein